MVARHTQQPTSILIVEDEPLIARATAQKITRFGYEVVTAHTGEEAVRLATDHHNISLILMDIDLGGGIDGTEAAQQILAVRHIPIIFLTAHTEEAYVSRAKTITCYGYVIKGSGDFALKSSIEMAFELFREHEKPRKSEEKYRTLVETRHEGIWQIDRESYTTYVNSKMADILGYSVDEMMGKHLFEFMDDRGVELGKQLLVHRRTGIAEQHEFEFIRKDGNRIYVLVEATPIMDEDGNYDGALAVLMNITERKKVEEALKESENHLKLILENVPVGIGMTKDRTITMANPTINKMLGYEEGELIGKYAKILYGNPKEFQRVGNYKYPILKEQGFATIETRFCKKNGHFLDVTMNTSVIDPHDLSAGFISSVTDITERKKAEQDLKESEKKYRALFEGAKDAIFLADSETGIILDVNTQAETLLGRPKEEIVGMHQSELHPHFQKKQVRTSFNDDVERQEETIFKEFQVVHKDGHTIPVEISPSIIQIEGRQCVYGIFRDITERKKAEQALKTSEEQFRTLVNTSPFPIAIADTADEKILFWSKSAQDLVGHTPKTVAEWYALAYPDPHYRQDVIARWKPYLEQAQYSKTAVNTGEYQIVCRDGSIKICELYAQFIPDRLIVTINDITERKKAAERLRQSEEKYRTLFENVTNAIFMFDPDTFEILEANEATSKLYGYNHAELIGMSCLKFSAEVDKSKTVSQQVRKKGQANAPLRHHKKKDGSDIYVKLTVYKISVSGRDVMFAVCTDITERKQAEAALQEYSERLEEMVEERTQKLREAQEQLIRREKLATMGQLSGSVAHELRRPLGVINQALYLLQTLHANGEAETIEYLDIIAGQVHKSAKIISDLLNFSRTGLAERAEREEIIVSSLVQRVLAAQPAPEPVDVRVEIAATLPPVFVDNQHIEQVLTNLVSNAYQAMPNGGRLTISAQPDADKVVLAVADTGAGISPENIDKLFEPLFTTKTKGIGLGLAVSKNLVEANGGSIKVESEVGEGSIFTIRLPLA